MKCVVEPQIACAICNSYDECALRDRQTSIHTFKILFVALSIGLFCIAASLFLL